MIQVETIIGIAAGTLTAVSLIPQLTKMIREKKGTDISVGMLVVLLSGLVLWIGYGILKKDWPVIITNCTSLVLNVCIMVIRSYYKRHGK